MGRGLPFFVALPAEPCPCEPPGGGRQCACGDPAKQCRQRCMDLVGMNPARDVQQISDVLGTGASRARSGESRVV